DFEVLKDQMASDATISCDSWQFSLLQSGTHDGTPWGVIDTTWSETDRAWRISSEVTNLRSVASTLAELPFLISDLGQLTSNFSGNQEIIGQTDFEELKSHAGVVMEVAGVSEIGDFATFSAIKSVDPTDTSWQNIESRWNECDFDWNNVRL
ncbi:MAG: hypothetical protein DSY80_03900, partial [Desulfocapsa sp.]